MDLSPSWEAPIVQLHKNFPALYGTRRFISVFTRALHSSLTSARSTQSILSHPMTATSISPNLISIFFRLRRLYKQSVHVWLFLWSSITSLLLTASCYPHGQPPSLRNTPCRLSRLLIQHIRRTLPHLEGVSSICNLRTRHAVVTREPPNMENHA
jgi:hypothetical protein